MSSIRLILASLMHYWRSHLAVALGVAAGTAVLTGALLVGDSMRGSLRRLALDRLGRIDYALVTDRFFRAALADELAAGPEFASHFSAAVPVILLPASIEAAEADPPRRANRVNLIGCDQHFAALGPGLPLPPPSDRQIVLNQDLADQLGARAGDAVLLRLQEPGMIPADSPLGRKNETLKTFRLTVGAIVPSTGLGRFDLRANQRTPRNAYVSLAWLQRRLEQPGRANALFVAGRGVDPTPADDAALAGMFRPSLSDYGIHVRRTPRGYVNITSDRLLIEPRAEQAILEARKGPKAAANAHTDAGTPVLQPALTYLANALTCRDRQVPYSTITAIDFADRPPLGPMLSPEGKPVPPLADDQIALNSWAAEDLGAKPGDAIRVTFFEPESTHGAVRERSVDLKLACVVALEGAADDRNLTPEVPGVTDKLTMADWSPPFPFDARRLRTKDEMYWDDHGTTPKAFVSLATGRRLWASRFGQTTSLRMAEADSGPKSDAPGEKAAARSEQSKGSEKAAASSEGPAPFALRPSDMGWVFQPVKRQALVASAGTTPFNVLFLLFSFFIIAAAVMLVALLFRLGIEQRARQLGTLAAVGFTRRRIAGLMVAEGASAAAIGSLLGAAAGIGYAALMLWGLRTWWLAAVVTPFLQLEMTRLSLVLGFTSGTAVAVATIAWTIRYTRHVPPRQLLAGQVSDPLVRLGRGRRWAGKLALAMLVGAVVLGFWAARLDEDQQAGAFFGAGALVLIACLAAVWSRLRVGATGAAVAAGRGNLLRMAIRSAARNPGRSALCIGLVAAACFLIVSISAFRVDPTQQVPAFGSGNGGFALVAESTQPIYQDINSPAGRAELGFSPEERQILVSARIFALRVKPGDDASCLNLYRPQQPRVLGVPRAMIDRGGFAWARSPKGCENPWTLLDDSAQRAADGGGNHEVPAILDVNTATYSLHLGYGDTLEITNGHGQPMRLKVVALLAGSVLQGDVLIGERDFLENFPEVSGYRFFLGETAPDRTDALAAALDRALGDYGLETETTGQRLARFLAVQNTYLSTFQSLGGLGLLLGTFGLAAVQLRNVLQRRGELALLRAVGFRRASLAWMVLLESGSLLGAGLASGVLAALVALAPHLLGGAAGIPWLWLALSLGLVLLVGLLSSLLAVRAVMHAPVSALGEENG